MFYHAGGVYIYDLSSSNLTFANYKAMYYGFDRAARFGKSLVWAGDEDLVVSAPSYTTYNTMAVSNEQGLVYYFSGAANLNGQYSNMFATKQFETEEPGCRHGDTLKWNQETEHLIVSSPFCHNSDESGAEQRLAGRVYFFSQNQTARMQHPPGFLA